MAGGLEVDGVCWHDPDMQTDTSFQEQIKAVEQMRGRDGLRALRAKACEVGVGGIEKRN